MPSAKNGMLWLAGIQAARGVLPIAAAARRDRIPALLLPRANHAEAAVVEGLRLFGVGSLGEAVRALAAEVDGLEADRFPVRSDITDPVRRP